jgi:hypothetical protein
LSPMPCHMTRGTGAGLAVGVVSSPELDPVGAGDAQERDDYRERGACHGAG